MHISYDKKFKLLYLIWNTKEYKYGAEETDHITVFRSIDTEKIVGLLIQFPTRRRRERVLRTMRELKSDKDIFLNCCEKAGATIKKVLAKCYSKVKILTCRGY